MIAERAFISPRLTSSAAERIRARSNARGGRRVPKLPPGHAPKRVDGDSKPDTPHRIGIDVPPRIGIIDKPGITIKGDNPGGRGGGLPIGRTDGDTPRKPIVNLGSSLGSSLGNKPTLNVRPSFAINQGRHSLR
jgi:hypothetical protein